MYSSNKINAYITPRVSAHTHTLHLNNRMHSNIQHPQSVPRFTRNKWMNADLLPAIMYVWLWVRVFVRQHVVLTFCAHTHFGYKFYFASKFETNCGWIDETAFDFVIMTVEFRSWIMFTIRLKLPLFGFCFFFFAKTCLKKVQVSVYGVYCVIYHLFHFDSNGYILCDILTMHVILVFDWSFCQHYVDKFAHYNS